MAKLCLSISWRQVTIVVSILFLNLPNGIPWLYGNLITYIKSYLFVRKGTAGFDLDPTWPLSLFSITYNIGLAAPGLMVKYMGLRVTTLICVLLADLAMFLSYFTSQVSVSALCVTLGVLSGLSIGAISCVSLIYMCAWFPNHLGSACAFSSCSSGGGSIFSNLVITTYINPTNLHPDITQETAIYFSQNDLLNRVPLIFLVFGAISCALHLTGWILLQAPPTEEKPHIINSNEHEMKTTFATTNDTENTKISIPTHVPKVYTQDEKTANKKKVSVNNIAHFSQTANDTSETVVLVIKNSDKSPKEILQMRTFYLVWLTIGVLICGLLIQSNFYKQFGQTMVRDDKFFSIVGSIYSVGNVGGRLLTGYILDKTGLKITIIIYLLVNTIVFIFWYHSVILHPILYAIFSVLIVTETTSAFVISSYAALTLYGKTYFSVNTGLIFSSTVLVSIIVPLIAQPILSSLGWFWLFQCESIPSLLLLTFFLIFFQ